MKQKKKKLQKFKMQADAVLSYNLDEGKEILEKNNFKIRKISYLNSSAGIPKIVRVRKVQEKEIDLLVAYHEKYM